MTTPNKERNKQQTITSKGQFIKQMTNNSKQTNKQQQ